MAAVGATSAIFDLIVGFAVGVGNGMGIIIARNYGAKTKTNYENQSPQLLLLVAFSVSS